MLEPIELSDNGAGGTFTPAFVELDPDIPHDSVQFTYTPPIGAPPAVYTLSLMSDFFSTIYGSPWTYTTEAEPMPAMYSTGFCGALGEVILLGCSLADGITCAEIGCHATTIEEVIVCLLKSIGIIPSAGFRPQTSQSPTVTYNLDDKEYQHVMTGSAHYADATFSIAVYAFDLSEAATLSQTIWEGIDSIGWTYIGSVFVQSSLVQSSSTQAVSYGSGNDQYYYVTRTTYWIQYSN